MGIEKMPSGRRIETRQEDETCPDCKGKGTFWHYKDERLPPLQWPGQDQKPSEPIASPGATSSLCEGRNTM